MDFAAMLLRIGPVTRSYQLLTQAWQAVLRQRLRPALDQARLQEAVVDLAAVRKVPAVRVRLRRPGVLRRGRARVRASERVRVLARSRP
jgi:hypothetical protein